MKYKHLLILSLLFITVTIDSRAQIDDKYKKLGDESFENNDYFSAALYYSKALSPYNNTKSFFVPFRSGSKKIVSKPSQELLSELFFKQAESYRLLNDFSNAKTSYENYFSTYTNAFPFARLWYGVTLRSLSDLDRAEEQLKLFVKNYTIKDKYFVLANRELSSCSYIRNQMRVKQKVKVQKFSKLLNESGSNYALVPIDNSQFVYSSLILESGKGPKLNYVTSINKKQKGDSTESKIIVKDLGSIKIGSVSISSNNLTMYFTGWENKLPPDNKLSIYQTKRKIETDSWDKPEKCLNPINIEGYNSKDPFLTVDGKWLIFSSNRTKGIGGYDLWISNVEESKDRFTVMNLGSIINTTDDEVSPYYRESESTLYFSSNGRIGLGGMDVFSSKGTLTNLKFSTPGNLGISVNSVKDDIYFTKMTDQYFVTSDRNSSCCLELFSIKPAARKLYLTVKDFDTKLTIIEPFVSLKEADSIPISKTPIYKSDSKEEYFDIDGFDKLLITVQKQGYKEVKSELQFKQDIDEYTADIFLHKEAVAPKQTVTDVTEQLVNNKILDSIRHESIFTSIIYFDFNANNIRNEEFEMLNRSLIRVKQDHSLKVMIYSYSDCMGTEDYNMKLSALRSQAVFNYFKNNGIAPNRIDTKFFGKDHLIKGCSDQNYISSEQLVNRRSEIFLLKY